MEFVFTPRTYERLKGVYAGSVEPVECSGIDKISAQGFCLRIEPASVHVEASDAAGLFYGRQTLSEIMERYPDGGIPCCRIEDWPDFKSRGYMLDISRDRVPSMDHLFHLVDQLAKLRYNQLQLYTEHTFAYSEHRTVWEKASPMTASEVCALDQYCRERYIELVPNQNSFGHMERWLEHDAYKHLAECPGGFRHPISGVWRPQGSVIKPDTQSLEFLHGLYDELLPNFRSKKFNIGGDEPWELGEGASADRVKPEGKHRVYADFLARICQLATEHGTEPMCWADVLLEEPSVIDLLPRSIRPVLWGYEADHPFEIQCSQLKDLGRDFYVAPGDSTWTSYSGRLPTMLANVRSAAQTGDKYGASGLLMTHWGDGGHPQPWPVSLPGMVWAGLLSWNVNAEEAALEKGLRLLLDDQNGVYVQILIESGKVDETLGVKLVNRSYLAHVNQLGAEALRSFEPKPSETLLRQVVHECEEQIQTLPRSELNAPDAAYLMDELELALRMNRHAAKRCLGEVKHFPSEMRERYQRCWYYRSRPGGLGDSLSKINKMKV